MTNVIAFLHSFFATTQDKFQGREDRGATAVEYGLMVGLIAAVIITAVGFLGTDLDALFDQIVTAIPGGHA